MTGIVFLLNAECVLDGFFRRIRSRLDLICRLAGCLRSILSRFLAVATAACFCSAVIVAACSFIFFKRVFRIHWRSRGAALLFLRCAGAGAGAGVAAGAGCSVFAGACSDFCSLSPQAASARSETAASETANLFFMVFLSIILKWPLNIHITQYKAEMGFVFVFG